MSFIRNLASHVDKMKFFIFPIYIAFVILYSCTLATTNNLVTSYNYTNASSHLNNFHKYHLCYLSFWTTVLELAFLISAIIHRIQSFLKVTLDVRKFFNWITSYLFSSFVFPVTFLVTVSFWTLYWIDREQVFPEDLDAVLPRWSVHVTHTSIVIPVIVESLLPKKHDFMKYWTCFISFTIGFAIYILVLLVVYSSSEMWIYPIFATGSWTWKILLFQLEYLLGIVFLTVGIYVQNLKISKEVLQLDKSGANTINAKICRFFVNTRTVLCPN